MPLSLALRRTKLPLYFASYLPAAAFPGALKIDFLAVDRSRALLRYGFDRGAAQPHHMIVARTPPEIVTSMASRIC